MVTSPRETFVQNGGPISANFSFLVDIGPSRAACLESLKVLSDLSRPTRPLLQLSAWTRRPAQQVTNVPTEGSFALSPLFPPLGDVVLAALVLLQSLQKAVYLAAYPDLMAVICGSWSGITYSVSRGHLFPIIDFPP